MPSGYEGRQGRRKRGGESVAFSLYEVFKLGMKVRRRLVFTILMKESARSFEGGGPARARRILRSAIPAFTFPSPSSSTCRIEHLLAEELGLPFTLEDRIEFNDRDCWTKVNSGCIVIAMQARTYPISPEGPAGGRGREEGMDMCSVCGNMRWRVSGWVAISREG